MKMGRSGCEYGSKAQLKAEQEYSVDSEQYVGIRWVYGD